jgi:acyl dehydratase
LHDRVITTIDELRATIGGELGVGPWIETTQAKVDAFNDATLGRSWLYNDPERAARDAPFGGTILPGNMTLSLANVIPHNEGGEGALVLIPYKRVFNYGFNKIRWISPVRVGKRVRAHNEVLAIEEVAPDVFRMTSRVTVEIEGEEKPAMVGENLTQFYM